MKTTTNYKGHRWTNEELKTLMQSWAAGLSLEEIGKELNATQYAIGKMVVKLRQQGIPLERRKKGHVAGRANTNWSHSEVEYLIRRRKENVTVEQIGLDLGRTYLAVNSMIGKLRKEGVSVSMLGQGVRRLWDVNLLKVTAMAD